MKHTGGYIYITSLVRFPAVFSGLTTGAGERAKISHLDHGVSEVGQECGLVCTVRPDLSIRRAVIEEHLIRMEQTLLAY